MATTRPTEESHGAVLDAHAHLFSRPFFECLARQAGDLLPKGEELNAIHERTGVEIPGDSIEELAERWVQEMDRHQIERMVLMASIPGDEASTLQAFSIYPERIIPYAMFNPLAKGSHAALEGAAAEGLRGVCLFPAMHAFRVDQPEVAAFLEVAAQAHLIVFVHFGLLRLGLRDKLGMHSPFDLRFANPIDLCQAAYAHPETPFVIPHLGAGFFRETLLLASQCDNVLLDTSSSNSWVKTQPGCPSVSDAFAQALDVIGPQRLLFGSDSNVFPRGYRKDILDIQVSILRDLGVSAEEEVMIFGENLLRLLGGD